MIVEEEQMKRSEELSVALLQVGFFWISICQSIRQYTG